MVKKGLFEEKRFKKRHTEMRMRTGQHLVKGHSKQMKRKCKDPETGMGLTLLRDMRRSLCMSQGRTTGDKVRGQLMDRLCGSYGRT